MKIAIVQDDLMRRGGAEQVALTFHRAFPEAPIYTLCYQPELTYPEFKSAKIITSSYQRLVKTEEQMKRYFFPLGLLAMRQMKVEGFDVVLMSATFCAKYVKISKNTLVICYCHNPFRLAWEPESYPKIASASFFKKQLYRLVIKTLRKLDKASTKNIHYFIANSRIVASRIEKAYGTDKEIITINPPVKCNDFYISTDSKNYYLVVSRFEPYKKVELVLSVFRELNTPLMLVGNGSMIDEIKNMAGDNVTIRSKVPKDELAKLFANCKALIFPQFEDYGITPLEANASGRPVIAYGKGGVLETMEPYKNDASKASALFFDQQDEQSLKKALKEFETLQFSPDYIKAHARKFDEQVFIDKIAGVISSKLREHNPKVKT